MLLKINHSTRYRFSTPVSYAVQQLRMTPKNRDNQAVIDWSTHVEGGQKQASYDDHNNNLVELVSIDAGATEVVVYASGTIETKDTAGVIGQTGGYAPNWLFERSSSLTKPGAGIKSVLRGFAPDPHDPIGSMHRLSAHIVSLVHYRAGITGSLTTSEEAIKLGCGVCQDHTHVFCTAARQLGFPARYVSGYLMMNNTQMQDATHAWAEVLIESLGWVGFDISNQMSPDEKYVRVATGIDATQAAPISGLRYGASGEEMLVTVNVQQ